jgi:anaerobic selenocysteine-containing dehydrogenase
MHPHTARQANIQEGDWVWVETPLGRVRQCARLTEDLQRAVIHADRWWYPERADDLDDPFGWRTTNINVCTEGAPDQCDPVLGTWLLRGLPCRIEKDTGSIDSEATS